MARSRSPNYPSLNLGDAIDAMRPIFQKDGRNPLSRLTVAKHLDYSSLNGRSMAKIGALRGYGLLDGSGDDLRVSDNCVALLRAPEGSDELSRALWDTFNAPTLFRELNNELDGTTVSKENLVWRLDQKGFIPDAAERAAQTYLESRALVTLETGDYNSSQVVPIGVATEHDQTLPITAVRNPPVGQAAQKTGPTLMLGERIVFTEEAKPNQYVKLVASGEVDKYLLDALGAFVKRQKKRLGCEVEEDISEVAKEPTD